MTADGEHAVGPVPGVRGLYVAGGCCVGGLSIAPAIGEALAAWIIDGSAAARPVAAGAGARATGSTRSCCAAACRLRYAHHYWQEMPAAAG